MQRNITRSGYINCKRLWCTCQGVVGKYSWTRTTTWRNQRTPSSSQSDRWSTKSGQTTTLRMFAQNRRTSEVVLNLTINYESAIQKPRSAAGCCSLRVCLTPLPETSDATAHSFIKISHFQGLFLSTNASSRPLWIAFTEDSWSRSV